MARKTQQNATPLGRRKAKWEKAFLTILAATGNVSDAALRAGVERSTAYRLKEAEEDFSQAWDEALEVACDALELEARRRAFIGTSKPVFYKGVECGYVREYSDTLMQTLLKAHRPGKFRERQDTLNVSLTAEELAKLPDEKLDALIDKLTRRA